MSKLKVGDEVAIAAVVKITAIQNRMDGMVSYNTDRGLSIHERLMDEIALSEKPTDRLMGREEPKQETPAEIFYKIVGRPAPEPKPQPAPRFKVGDRVVHDDHEVGTVLEVMNGRHGLYMWYLVRFGSLGDCCFCESDLSPAPEPKYYNGKVFAVGSRYIELQGRDGCVFEIKNGYIPENLPVFNEINVTHRVKTFKEFTERFNATEWKEVKE